MHCRPDEDAERPECALSRMRSERAFGVNARCAQCAADALPCRPRGVEYYRAHARKAPGKDPGRDCVGDGGVVACRHGDVGQESGIGPEGVEHPDPVSDYANNNNNNNNNNINNINNNIRAQHEIK